MEHAKDYPIWRSRYSYTAAATILVIALTFALVVYSQLAKGLKLVLALKADSSPITISCIATNTTAKPIETDEIGVNNNRLYIISPDGKEKCNQVDALTGRRITIKPHSSYTWNFEIAKKIDVYHIKKEPGIYHLYWKVGKNIKSNEVLFVIE